jgi:hypothetical protein
MENCFLVAVDPVGVPMDSLELDVLISSGCCTEAELLFRVDDIERVEKEYPKLETVAHNEINPPGIKGDIRTQNEKTERDSVPTFSFYKNGDIWMIGEIGKEKQLTHLKGFKQIWLLLNQ